MTWKATKLKLRFTCTGIICTLEDYFSACCQCRWSLLLMFPPEGWVTSFIRTPLSSAAATMPACVLNAVSACHSWTLRLELPRTIATSGWNATNATPVGKHRLTQIYTPAQNAQNKKGLLPSSSSWGIQVILSIPYLNWLPLEYN